MKMIFRQFFEKESSTYTYLLGDVSSREAILIDGVRETMERDLQFIRELGLELKYLVETHIHADHITSSGLIREKTGAKIVIGSGSALETADRLLEDGEEIAFGEQTLKAIATPGHTDGCTSYYCPPYVFTGDALLIRGCGRVDFQQGSSQKLFHSVREKLFKLPDETLICPCHDYKGRTRSSIGEEKQHNPRLGLDKSFEEFDEIMKNLNLPRPKKIDEAVPANMQSGLHD
ncbi:MBL fold metallo-hydrolase [Wenzhouxiangella sp. XN201]|uniref:MBL fold metallo-hydrolase n=1 Tax=Wenzhouxiangella sp. XN201 TaxID=2710755 RepID=UPI001F09C13F|nr:MBL fold metallo-hydrolase [Wenzhouxiangella sp. XN201]